MLACLTCTCPWVPFPASQNQNQDSLPGCGGTCVRKAALAESPQLEPHLGYNENSRTGFVKSYSLLKNKQVNFKLVLKIDLKTVRKEDQIKCTARGTKETMEIRAEITKQIRKNF